MVAVGAVAVTLDFFFLSKGTAFVALQNLGGFVAVVHLVGIYMFVVLFAAGMAFAVGIKRFSVFYGFLMPLIAIALTSTMYVAGYTAILGVSSDQALSTISLLSLGKVALALSFILLKYFGLLFSFLLATIAYVNSRQ